jgi:hypothetical protein
MDAAQGEGDEVGQQAPALSEQATSNGEPREVGAAQPSDEKKSSDAPGQPYQGHDPRATRELRADADEHYDEHDHDRDDFCWFDFQCPGRETWCDHRVVWMHGECRDFHCWFDWDRCRW